MKFSIKIVDCIQLLTIFAKHFILGVSQGYEYVCDKAKQNPIYLFNFNTTITDQLLVISLVKVKKSKTNYIVLF